MLVIILLCHLLMAPTMSLIIKNAGTTKRNPAHQLGSQISENIMAPLISA
jgi:hypothetical protein